MCPARSLTAWCLTVALLVAAIGAGAARGDLPPVGTVVICRGLVVTEIAVDATGQPVEHRAICPEAVFALLSPVPTHAPVIWSQEPPGPAAWPLRAEIPPNETRSHRAGARGPPARV